MPGLGWAQDTYENHITARAEFEQWHESKKYPELISYQDTQLALQLYSIVPNLETTERNRLTPKTAQLGGILTSLGFVSDFEESYTRLGITRDGNKRVTLWLYGVDDPNDASCIVPLDYVGFGIWVLQWENVNGRYKLVDFYSRGSVRVKNYPQSEGGEAKAKRINRQLATLAAKMCTLSVHKGETGIGGLGLIALAEFDNNLLRQRLVRFLSLTALNNKAEVKAFCSPGSELDFERWWNWVQSYPLKEESVFLEGNQNSITLHFGESYNIQIKKVDDTFVVVGFNQAAPLTELR